MPAASLYLMGASVIPVDTVARLTSEDRNALCLRPYPGHRAGCPNYRRKHGCPPTAPPLDQLIVAPGPGQPFRMHIVVQPFDLGGFARMMKDTHQGWSWAQCRNSRYWQATVMKALRKAAYDAAKGPNGRYLLRVVEVPEAHGVNVTETCRRVGVELEWPPVYVVRKVMLLGFPRDTPVSS